MDVVLRHGPNGVAIGSDRKDVMFPSEGRCVSRFERLPDGRLSPPCPRPRVVPGQAFALRSARRDLSDATMPPAAGRGHRGGVWWWDALDGVDPLLTCPYPHDGLERRDPDL